MNKISEVRQKVNQLLGIVRELELLYPDRKFTLDGHLVGSIGEVLAAEKYSLSLLPSQQFNILTLSLIKQNLILKNLAFEFKQSEVNRHKYFR